MRKDILEDMKPNISRKSTNINVPGVCAQCVANKVIYMFLYTICKYMLTNINHIIFAWQISDPSVCRNELNHTAVPSSFTAIEKQECGYVTEAMAHIINNLKDSNKYKDTNNKSKTAKVKREYRYWDANEIHNLLTAISIVGFKNTSALAQILENRTEKVVRRCMYVFAYEIYVYVLYLHTHLIA